MINFKIITEESPIVVKYLKEIKKNSLNPEKNASKVFTKFSYITTNTGEGHFQTTLFFEHLFPDFIWKLGFIPLGFALLFWNAWLLIPVPVFLVFRFINSNLFFYLMLNKGLQKKGYKGNIEFLRVA